MFCQFQVFNFYGSLHEKFMNGDKEEREELKTKFYGEVEWLTVVTYKEIDITRIQYH